MERIVASPIECRENAAECLGWANGAKSNKERDIFLQMARAWLSAAVKSEVGPQLEATSGGGTYRDHPALSRQVAPLKPSDMLRRRAAR